MNKRIKEKRLWLAGRENGREWENEEKIAFGIELMGRFVKRKCVVMFGALETDHQ